MFVGFDIFTAVYFRILVFRNVMPCHLGEWIPGVLKEWQEQLGQQCGVTSLNTRILKYYIHLLVHDFTFINSPDTNSIEIINLDRSRSRSPSLSNSKVYRRRRSRSRSRGRRRGRRSRSRSGSDERSRSRSRRRR